MGLFTEIFSWWGGNTWGTRFTLWRHGRFVGEDEFGNRYFEQKSGRPGPLDRPRRWVTYKSMSEASQIPPGWHGWMHHTVDDPPTAGSYTPRPWQKAHEANPTGTPGAYRPAGSILTASASRPRATGDYKPWQPD
jgi:NADH:ubiquinone oxidoreductase subunit